MPKVTYPRSSPYHHTKQTSWAIGRYSHRRVPPHVEDQPFEVKPRHEHRPDLLSQELYGTPAYFWVFTARNINLMRHPIWDLKNGMTIMVPSASFIKTFVG